jgi:hypothetical protein
MTAFCCVHASRLCIVFAEVGMGNGGTRHRSSSSIRWYVVQDDFLKDYELPIKACQTFQLGAHTSASAVDYYEDQFASVRNLMCQLNSLATVTALWRDTKREYDAVLYLRPDVLYNCPFPVERLDSLEDKKVRASCVYSIVNRHARSLAVASKAVQITRPRIWAAL